MCVPRGGPGIQAAGIASEVLCTHLQVDGPSVFHCLWNAHEVGVPDRAEGGHHLLECVHLHSPLP